MSVLHEVTMSDYPERDLYHSRRARLMVILLVIVVCVNALKFQPVAWLQSSKMKKTGQEIVFCLAETVS